MAEPTVAFPEPGLREPMVYRRVSGFAIAGMVLAGFFSALVFVEVVLAFVHHSPVLMPLWVQSLALAGGVFSLMGLIFVGRSEGTLAGRKLALWGLWLSIIFGLGYWSYYGAAYFAVTQQAQAFALRFFQKIQKGDINAAFLDMQSPGVRKTINADDEKELRVRFDQPTSASGAGSKGPLSSFHEHEIVRVIHQAGDEAKFEPRGVMEWDYKDGKYNIRQMFRILSPEGWLDVSMLVIGGESKNREYEGRDWEIVWNELKAKPLEPSELGAAMVAMRHQSQKFIDLWGRKLVDGQTVAAYLDTLPPGDERRQIGRNYLLRSCLAGFAGGTVPTLGSPAGPLLATLPARDLELGGALFLPGYNEQFRQAGIVHTDKFLVEDPDLAARLVSYLKGVFSGKLAEPRLLAIRVASPQKKGPWKLDGEHALLEHDVAFGFEPIGNGPIHSVDAVVTVEGGGAPIDARYQHSWRIVKLELITGLTMDPMTFLKQAMGGRNLPPGFPVPPLAEIFRKRPGAKLMVEEDVQLPKNTPP